MSQTNAICPYCEIEVEMPILIKFKRRREMYSCPHCHKILGFARWN